jgi:hypothetical protein
MMLPKLALQPTYRLVRGLAIPPPGSETAFLHGTQLETLFERVGGRAVEVLGAVVGVVV